MRKNRKSYTPAFKAKVALAALEKDRKLRELSQEFDVHINLVNKWKKQLLEHSEKAFISSKRLDPKVAEQIETLEQELLEAKMVNEFFVSHAHSLSKKERKAMIQKDHPLSLAKQCRLLNLSRSGLYYQPKNI